MAKTVTDMDDLLNDPDKIDMDDEEAVLALAEQSDITDEDEEGGDTEKAGQAATDTDEEESGKKPEDNKPGASDSKAEGDDDLTDDDTKAPVQSKDGKHTIPYDVLDSTRKNLKTANEQLDAERAERERLQALLEQGKSGGDVSDDDLDEGAEDGITADSTPEEAFTAKTGMGYDEFQREYGDGLLKTMKATVNETLEIRKQIGVLMEDRTQAENEQRDAQANSLQEDIDAVPALAKIQSEGGEKWQEAIEVDDAYQKLPRFKGVSRLERFKAVAKEIGLSVTDEKKPSSKEKTVDDAGSDDDELPTSISDLPGGSSASQSERESIEKMDVVDIGLKFESMTPAQQEEYLNSL